MRYLCSRLRALFSRLKKLLSMHHTFILDHLMDVSGVQ
jgi:hypothetical protein